MRQRGGQIRLPPFAYMGPHIINLDKIGHGPNFWFIRISGEGKIA